MSLLHGGHTALEGAKKINEISKETRPHSSAAGRTVEAAATGGVMTGAALVTVGVVSAPVVLPLVAAGAIGGAAFYGIKSLFK